MKKIIKIEVSELQLLKISREEEWKCHGLPNGAVVQPLP